MKIICFITSIFFCLYLQAQIQFKTEKIKKIATHLPSKVLRNEDVLVKWSGSPQPIVKRIEKGNTLSHLGIYLFNEETRTALQDHADFLERIMLELMLYKNDNQVKAKLNEYKMKWMLNDRNEEKPYTSLVKFLSAYNVSDVAVGIDFSDKIYVAHWKQGNNKFSLSYSAVRELIQGTDLKEAEANFFYKLKQLEPVVSKSSSKPINISQLSPIKGKLYRKIGICHSEQPSYCNDTYYFRTDDTNTALPIYDKNYPALSMINMMAGVVPCHNRKIQMSVHLYGGKIETLSMPFSILYSSLFADMQCYLKLDMSNPEKYYARFYYLNEQMQYVHVAEVEISPNNIFKEDVVWKGHMYMFIPEYNQKMK